MLPTHVLTPASECVGYYQMLVIRDIMTHGCITRRNERATVHYIVHMPHGRLGCTACARHPIHVHVPRVMSVAEDGAVALRQPAAVARR